MPLAPPVQGGGEVFQAVGDDAVDAQVQQTLDLLGIVDRPNVHGHTRPVRTRNRPSRDEFNGFVCGRHLEHVEARADATGPPLTYFAWARRGAGLVAKFATQAHQPLG